MNKFLKEDNFIYISNFISPERANELALEFKDFNKKHNISGDNQIPESESVYNYIGFLELLCEKTPEVSKFVGETVLPTYSYARTYRRGAELAHHKDRAACEISLTVHLSGDHEWPISIEKPNGDCISLNLKFGDAMLYMGCDAAHWRDKFQGSEYNQVFLHYVKSRGDRNFAFFDRAKTKEESTINNGIIEVTPDHLKNEIVDTELSKKQITEDTQEAVFPTNIEDYVVVFENILSDELCDKIIKEYENSEEFSLAMVGGSIIDQSIRNVNIVHTSFEGVISRNPHVRKNLDNEIFAGANNAIRLYNKKFPMCNIEQDSGYDLLKYEVGQHYIQHVDSFKDHPREISCSFALNDDYEGGEFTLFGRKLKYKLKKGSVLMFPSNFMYPHEIMPVTKGTRWSIITWFI
jgi:hypothetical protein